MGWNDVEYEALGEDFHDRGRRIEEQVELLRALWTEPVVDFAGRWHRVTEAGINPLPVQRPIPIWFGGQAEPVLRRVGRLGDGWFPQMLPDTTAGKMIDRIRAHADAAGRDSRAIGIEPRVERRYGSQEQWPALVEGWRSLGATHIGVSTRGLGLTGAEHITAIERLHSSWWGERRGGERRQLLGRSTRTSTARSGTIRVNRAPQETGRVASTSTGSTSTAQRSPVAVPTWTTSPESSSTISASGERRPVASRTASSATCPRGDHVDRPRHRSVVITPAAAPARIAAAEVGSSRP